MATPQKRKYSDTAECNEENNSHDEVLDFTQKTWMSDVTFVVEGKKLYCSRTVLGLHSPVFRAMFGGNFRERNEEDIVLHGKKYGMVLQFLQFLLPNCNKEITKENINSILSLAHEYQVQTLVNKCEDFIKDMVSKTHISTFILVCLYMIAEKYNLDAAAETILSRLAEINPKDVLVAVEKNPQFKNILPSLQNKMMEKYFSRYKDLQLQAAKSNIDCENAPYYRWKDISEFENAQGSIASVTIEDFEDLLIAPKSGQNVKIISQSTVHMWDKSFIVECEINTSVLDDSSLPVLSFLLHCCNEPEIEGVQENWSCQVKVKLIIRCKNSPNGKISLKDTIVYFTAKTPSVTLYRSDIAEFLKPTKGFFINRRVEAEVFLLANEPTTATAAV